MKRYNLSRDIQGFFDFREVPLYASIKNIKRRRLKCLGEIEEDLKEWVRGQAGAWVIAQDILRPVILEGLEWEWGEASEEEEVAEGGSEGDGEEEEITPPVTTMIH